MAGTAEGAVRESDGCYNPAMETRLPALLVDIKQGVIDLGWGHPSPSLHPLEAVRVAADRLLSRGGTEPLQYGATQGYGPYLETLAEFLSGQESYGMSVDGRSLFLTAGASQALDLTCTLFAREGDTVLVEEPTYFVIEGIFKAHHLSVRGVPTNEKRTGCGRFGGHAGKRRAQAKVHLHHTLVPQSHEYRTSRGSEEKACGTPRTGSISWCSPTRCTR